MKILYIGDVMGEVGIETVENILPELVQSKSIDLVIAQAENVTNGKSMSLVDMKRLQDTGVHFFTGGNHTPALQEIHASLEDENVPIIGPANLVNCPGKGWKYIDTAHGRVLVISLMGSKVGAPIEADNPLTAIDEILLLNNDTDRIATIVNFHGDYSSEKIIIGHYLDGRVTAVVGDHWHVPTADARVLPGGTAHITDVGMCGILNSSLGITWDSVIPRWRDNIQTRNELETTGPRQFNAVLIVSDDDTQKAKSITHIQKVVE
jgi:metallophosphoesterase (TIGR00282 family)